MDRRLAARDASLNTPLAADSEQEWLDVLEDDQAVDPEQAVAEAEERALRMDLLAQAMQTLNDRERAIFTARRLQDPPALLEDLGRDFGVSRERVRQIEVRAFEKVQGFVTQGMKRKLREKRRRQADEVLAARGPRETAPWAAAYP